MRCASERKAAPCFHHHSAAIRELAAQKKTDEIIDYIDSMLSTSYEAIEFATAAAILSTP